MDICRILHVYPVFFRCPCQRDRHDHGWIYGLDSFSIRLKNLEWTMLEVEDGKVEKRVTCWTQEEGDNKLMWISAMLGHSNQRLSSACIYCVNACRTLIFRSTLPKPPPPPFPQCATKYVKKRYRTCVSSFKHVLFWGFFPALFCQLHTEYPTLLFLTSMIIVQWRSWPYLLFLFFFFEACVVALLNFRWTGV